MREKKEILGGLPASYTTDSAYLHSLIEVLLDIRDILREKEVKIADNTDRTG